MKPSRSAIVVVIDRFGAGFLGPYGNTWIDTSELNRLASESVLFEFAITDSPQLDRVYRSYWQGLHAMCGEQGGAADCLANRLASKNIETILLTDEPELSACSGAGFFSNQINLTPAPLTSPAGDLSEAQLAQTFASAIEQLEQLDSSSLFWIHAQGMQGRWDAPVEFRNQFADEDDPTPPGFTQPPNRLLEAGFDPDEVLGISHAYAGQVSLLDQCVGALNDALVSSRIHEETLLIFTSPRGFPLGEHLCIGAGDHALYGEMLHVPWFVRFPDRQGATTRPQTFVQPPDLYTTLLDWFQVEQTSAYTSGGSLLPVSQDSQLVLHDRACSTFDRQRAIRTPSWFLRQTDSQNELFAKPDDRWEMNEVSDRCAKVVQQMNQAYELYQAAANANDFSKVSPLPELLVDRIE